MLSEVNSRGYVRDLELQGRRKDGAIIAVSLSVSKVVSRNQRFILGIIKDVTAHKLAEDERDKLQSELQQAQKMESVGRLAGGVAHDFNNLLTAINGYAGFLMEGLPENDARREDVREILSAGERAAGLTRQLLAFSRRQILDLQILDLNGIVGRMVNMLTRLIGEDVKLTTRLAAEPCLVKVDPGQIEQVLMNLAVNARDAMPKGGTLALETEVATLGDDFFLGHPDMQRVPMVCLRVRDTGCGMTDDIKAKMFEPFFTTKGEGRGTGLGLPMVYGIIKQSGGDLEVESEPDRGTTIRIYLPTIDSKAGDRSTEDSETGSDDDLDSAPRGNETILLVEDEAIVRRLGQRALTAKGYVVLTAASGHEALRIIGQQSRPVDLLLADVVMPGMSGRDVAREIARQNQCRRTLYVSGYTDDAIVQHGGTGTGAGVLVQAVYPGLAGPQGT